MLSLIHALSLPGSHILAAAPPLPDGGTNWPLIWVLLLLGSAVAMFVSNRPGMDVVGLLMIAALPFTGVLTMRETLAGFSDPNIVLIAFLFVLGDGLVRTGIARRLGDWINRKAAGRETKLLLLLMLAVAGLGSVMSSTAIVAIFIPVVFRICRSSGIPASRLMMPVSFAALISGMLTLISTTPNLVVNAELVRQGAEGFHFFSITPFGLVVLALGLGYMKLARKWIPQRDENGSARTEVPTFRDWIEKYRLSTREKRVRVMPGSDLVGKCLADLHLRDEGVNLLAVERVRDRRRTLLRPTRSYCPEVGDILLLDVVVDPETSAELIRKHGVEELPIDPANAYFTDLSQDIGMSEAIIPVESSLVGRNVRDSRIRAEFGLTVIGLRRASEAIEGDLLDEKLRVGDTILITGFWKDIQRMQRDNKQIVLLDLPAEFEDVLPAANKGPYALGIFAFVVLMAPVAFAIAEDLGASPYPFAMVVMLAASAAFMTPVSSPVNTLVVSPGNYRFGDFVRVGVPFTIIVMIVAVIIVPILLPP